MTVLVGGARFQGEVAQWVSQSKNLFSVVFYAFLLVWAGFADKLPAIWRWQLSTTVGRLLLLLLLWVVFQIGGFVPATLFTIAICMTWANRPLAKPLTGESQSQEGYSDCVKTTKVPVNNRWFVEKTLLETPDQIIEDRVETDEITDDSSKSNGRTSR